MMLVVLRRSNLLKTVTSKPIYNFVFHQQNTGGLPFFEDLLITYLASIAIAAVNFIAPIIFGFFINFEDYAPGTALQITLVR